MVIFVTNKTRSLEKEVGKVLEEILKAVDFDIEILLESGPDEMEFLVFNAVLSVIDPDEIPFIEWVRMVEKEEVEVLRDERGEFIPN